MRKLPNFLKKYFWEVDFEKIDFEGRKEYVLRRLLEYGDERGAAFLVSNFNRDEVAKLLSYARIDPKSANFWAIVFNIDKRKVLCLQKHYLEIRKQHWPY